MGKKNQDKTETPQNLDITHTKSSIKQIGHKDNAGLQAVTFHTVDSTTSLQSLFKDYIFYFLLLTIY